MRVKKNAKGVGPGWGAERKMSSPLPHSKCRGLAIPRIQTFIALLPHFPKFASVSAQPPSPPAAALGPRRTKIRLSLVFAIAGKSPWRRSRRHCRRNAVHFAQLPHMRIAVFDRTEEDGPPGQIEHFSHHVDNFATARTARAKSQIAIFHKKMDAGIMAMARRQKSVAPHEQHVPQAVSIHVVDAGD